MNEPQRDFDQEAASWDENPVRVKMAGEIVRAMKAQVPFKPDMDILDFGCGTGLIAMGLAPLVRSVTGADTSRGMLDVLAAKAARLGRTNIRIRQLPEGGGWTGAYDAIVSSMAFHHIRHVDALLTHLFHALKTPGYLCVADLDPDQGEFHGDPTGVFHFGFERAALKSWFERAGFSRIADVTATDVTKPNRRGEVRRFGIFLMVGAKTQA